MTITGTRGIDVSHWNGAPDWGAAAAAGIAFAGSKIADGSTGSDPTGAADLRAILTHMLAAFPYLFVEPGHGVDQAVNLLSRVSSACNAFGIPLILGLPVGAGIMLDVESRGATAADVEACAAQCYAVTKLWPAVYTSPSYATAELHNDPALARSPLWLADWTPPADVPAPWHEWSFWQTGVAHVAGVAGPVDVDQFEGDTRDLQAFIRKPTLTLNAHHPSVGYLQRTLAAGTSLDVGPVDDWYGIRTAKAVAELQAYVGITVDSVVGSAETWPLVDLMASRQAG